jgi:hypothetical protein
LAAAGKGLALVLSKLGQLALTAAMQQGQLFNNIMRIVDGFCTFYVRSMAYKPLAYSFAVLCYCAIALCGPPVALLGPLWLLCFAHAARVGSSIRWLADPPTSDTGKQQDFTAIHRKISFQHFLDSSGALLALLGLCVIASVPSALAWIQQGSLLQFGNDKLAIIDAIHVVLLLFWPLLFLQMKSFSQQEAHSETDLVALGWQVCLPAVNLYRCHTVTMLNIEALRSTICGGNTQECSASFSYISHKKSVLSASIFS